MSIQYSFHQRLLAAGCSRVRFTNSILLYHSISVHASSSLLCTKLSAVYLALFALHRHLRPNERGLCFNCELKFNQYNMARIFSPFECASCNEPPHTLILSVAFFTTRFGYAAISGVSLVSPAFTIPTAASFSLHVAIQLQYRFGFLHLHEALFLLRHSHSRQSVRKKQ